MSFIGFSLIDYMIDGGLFHIPFPGITVIARQSEAMPIVIIQLLLISVSSQCGFSQNTHAAPK